MRISAFKKKLYKLRPREQAEEVDTFRTTRTTRIELADPTRLEREVRQLLANKISGNMAGIWLLIPEHLRLGTWDLLRQWSGKATENVQPRIALQLVHEAALCATGIRQARHFSQRGFELANGLPFVASDQAVHELLNAHTVAEAEALQVRLGIIRRASGHFKGELVAIDPFRKRSHTKRQTIRYRRDATTKPFKTANSFYALDSDTLQPICFIHTTASLPLIRSCPRLLALTADILNPQPGHSLVMADTEHYQTDLIDYVHAETPFDLLVPMPNRKSFQKRFEEIPSEAFKPRWAGYYTTKSHYQMKTQKTGPHFLYVQRSGEKPEEYEFKGFLSTRNADECHALTEEFPKRWHIEEFFNLHQDLGWKRAGTRNLNIRHAHSTMALFAQAASYQLRQRLGRPYDGWDAKHFADSIFKGLDGDIRVRNDTIVVTLYNAKELREAHKQFEDLPKILESENVDPRIPWLYNFKLDFVFK